MINSFNEEDTILLKEVRPQMMIQSGYPQVQSASPQLVYYTRVKNLEILQQPQTGEKDKPNAS